jgi:hypothetical protein
MTSQSTPTPDPQPIHYRRQSSLATGAALVFDGFCIRDGIKEQIGGVGDKKGIAGYGMKFSERDCKIATSFSLFQIYLLGIILHDTKNTITIVINVSLPK